MHSVQVSERSCWIVPGVARSCPAATSQLACRLGSSSLRLRCACPQWDEAGPAPCARRCFRLLLGSSAAPVLPGFFLPSIQPTHQPSDGHHGQGGGDGEHTLPAPRRPVCSSESRHVSRCRRFSISQKSRNRHIFLPFIRHLSVPVGPGSLSLLWFTRW